MQENNSKVKFGDAIAFDKTIRGGNPAANGTLEGQPV